MRSNLKAVVVLSIAAIVFGNAGCAKKSPAPAPAPPANPTTEQTPTPTPTPTTTPPTTTPLAPAISMSDLKTVYFPLDSYALDDGARAVLDANARLLRDRPDLLVRVEGHCDERGSVEYNMSLGEKRADSVRDYLVAAGVTASRLSTMSYGKERPVADGHDEATWSKNRRAEFSKP